MTRYLAAALALAATPAATPAIAAAAEHGFISLHNHELIVTISFLLFVGVLIYYKVPGMVTGLLDTRGEGIEAELSEARALREEAQTILASYERKQKEVAEQADHIIAHAKREAIEAAETAKVDLKSAIARRIVAAEDQIKSAENAAVREVRDTAVTVAVAAASDLVAEKMTAAEGNKLIDAAIKDVEANLH